VSERALAFDDFDESSAPRTGIPGATGLSSRGETNGNEQNPNEGQVFMKIECVIVCVDYGDFLAETLPHNLPHFDRTLVITSPKDVETQELCRRLSVPYYATNIFYKDGDCFNKARGIDFGLSYLRWNDWVVHLDADVYLPPLTRQLIEWRNLDTESIYGIDRVNCVGYEAWKKFEARHHTGHDFMCRVKVPDGMPLLDRIAIRDYGGYIPIGYFQMWHGSLGRRYPIAKGDAEHTDVLHAIQWDADRRRLIPEVIGVHLLSGDSALGANWHGRKTPRFGPTAPNAPVTNEPGWPLCPTSPWIYAR
jgi:hypothetical protein